MTKNIAVLGYGVVGSGVVEVFYKNRRSMERKIGEDMDIKYILIKSPKDAPLYASKFTWTFEDIINDDSVSVVVEVMGGMYPAYDFVKRSLEKGKSVVTSNKELVAMKGAELLAIARKNNVNFLFEASVGGGIPIIRPIHQCLAANEIDEVDGILNGTTNFILTKMIKEKMSFQEALKIAQELGYAEKDPTADVEGIDACRKICILASLAYGEHIYPKNVHAEGISKITLDDVAYAQSVGGAIKLVGSCKRTNGDVFIMVSPCFLPQESQLATVDDVFNGIVVKGDAIGEVMFYGKGAGKLPTASAVMGDVVDCMKAKETIKSLQWEDSKKENNVAPWKNQKIKLFIRLKGKYEQEEILKLFPDCTFLAIPDLQEETAFITDATTAQDAQTALEGYSVVSMIRYLD